MNTYPQTYALIGAAMELMARRITFQQEVALPIKYKGRKLDCAYRADFICFGEILVEFKASEILGSVEQSQVINYLNATRFTRALLFNFGSPSLEYQRLVLNHPNSPPNHLRESAKSAGI